MLNPIRASWSCRWDVVLCVELEQVLEDEMPPALSARLDEQTSLRQPANLDRREPEMFRKRANIVRGSVVVARQEHGLTSNQDSEREPKETIRFRRWWKDVLRRTMDGVSSRGCLLRSHIAIRSPIRLFRPILLVP